MSPGLKLTVVSIVSFLFTSIFAVAPFSADFPKSCSSLLTSLIAFLLSSASFLLNNFLKNPPTEFMACPKSPKSSTNPLTAHPSTAPNSCAKKLIIGAIKLYTLEIICPIVVNACEILLANCLLFPPANPLYCKNAEANPAIALTTILNIPVISRKASTIAPPNITKILDTPSKIVLNCSPFAMKF